MHSRLTYKSGIMPKARFTAGDLERQKISAKGSSWIGKAKVEEGNAYHGNIEAQKGELNKQEKEDQAVVEAGMYL